MCCARRSPSPEISQPATRRVRSRKVRSRWNLLCSNALQVSPELGDVHQRIVLRASNELVWLRDCIADESIGQKILVHSLWVPSWRQREAQHICVTILGVQSSQCETLPF